VTIMTEALDPLSRVEPPAPRTSGRRRPPPERNADFQHLSLDGLRAYRRSLTEEEGRTSYWRRIIQARLDVVRMVQEGGGARLESVTGAFSQEAAVTRRTALVEVHPVDNMPPLPDLADLWDRDPLPASHPDSHEHNRRLAHDLMRAETQLSAYRSALHRRLAAATAELIARYHEQPQLCLTALPQEHRRRRMAG
jgi:hypothetical protein